MNNSFRMMWKEAVVTQLEVLLPTRPLTIAFLRDFVGFSLVSSVRQASTLISMGRLTGRRFHKPQEALAAVVE
jgi:hypothetical protein